MQSSLFSLSPAFNSHLSYAANLFLCSTLPMNFFYTNERVKNFVLMGDVDYARLTVASSLYIQLII
jgi:hypothetical protein